MRYFRYLSESFELSQGPSVVGDSIIQHRDAQRRDALSLSVRVHVADRELVWSKSILPKVDVKFRALLQNFLEVDPVLVPWQIPQLAEGRT